MEVSRWIKYQETVEPASNRWSKPHVSTPTLRGWLELRKALHDGLILNDVEATDFPSLCNLIRGQLISNELVTSEEAESLTDLWQIKHRHQFEGPRKAEGKLTSVIKELLVQKLESKAEKSGLQIPTLSEAGRRGSINVEKDQRPRPTFLTDGKVNVALQKKIASSSEAAIILEGQVSFQTKPLAIFVKLKHPLHLTDLPEVDIPTKYFFFYTGPPPTEPEDQLYYDIGVSLGVALSDKDFVYEVQNAQSGDDLKLALDEYMSFLKILPKDWPEEQKLDPPANVRKKIKDEMEEEIDEDRRYE